MTGKVRTTQHGGAFAQPFCNGSATMHSVSVADLQVTVYYIKIFSVAQECLYGKFMSGPRMEILHTSF
jgi:hypothetical protein